MSMLFSQEEMASIAGGVSVPAPKNYKLPDHFPSLKGVARIALDLESHDPEIHDKGPGWRRGAYPVGVSLAIQARDGTIPFSEYYPIKHKVGPNLSAEKVYEWLTDELAFYTGEIAGANLLYDADGLQYHGVVAPCAKWRDVQWAEALLDETAMSYRLNTLAQKWLGKKKVTEELKELYGDDYIQRFREVHPGHARAYGLGDVILPLQILNAQYKGNDQFDGLNKEHLTELFHLESRLLPFLLYMRKVGVRVDLDAAANLGKMLLAKRDAALRECTRHAGIEINQENFGKPTVIAAALDRLHIKYPMTAGTKDDEGETKTAPRPSITDKFLKDLDHPFGEQLKVANQCEKAYGTFVSGYVQDYAINGRVHCEFHPLRKDNEGGKFNGTVSGRFSGTHPNLQNIPARDEEIGPLCRAMFVADEGAEWWSQDYSQIEYRMLVHYSVALKCKGAEIPQQMYLKNPDTDFHEMCAALAWALEWFENERAYKAGEKTEAQYEKEKKRIRKPAKNLNFGLVYGMGVDKLARELNMIGPDGKPTQQAMDLIELYHAKAPFIKDLNGKCGEEGQRLGYITTILKRRSRFNMWEPKEWKKGQPKERPLPLADAEAKWGKGKIKRADTHKALNRRLQGSAADLMKLAMVLLWESGVFDPGNDITCVLTVHDELNGSVVPSERGKKALAEVKRIMENCMELAVPVLTSGSTGANWSEAK
jgi:Mesyanzhinovviridae DNA polymerase